MTDLSAGEHIIDALKIDMHHQLDVLWKTIESNISLPDILWYPNKQGAAPIPIRQMTPDEVMRLFYKLEPCVEQLETNVIARHPSSERFHSLLPTVAEMAYRLDAELAPHGATAWGIDAWVVPMRNMERSLRSLQAAARGDRTAKAPTTLMMEVSAYAMVAQKYHLGEYTSTWAHDYVSKMGTTHDDKQADYGTDDDPFHNVRASVDWGIEPWVGAMNRLSDKVNRLQSFAQKGVLKNESALDSIGDIAVYALIARVLYEQSHE